MKSLFVYIIVILSAPLFAESVFLTDGSIVEGKIVKETDTALAVKTIKGPDRSIQRARVLRVVYNDDYKNAVNLYMSDGAVIKGYIVEENNTEYIVRRELNSAKEIRVKKNNIDAVVKEGKEQKFTSKAAAGTVKHSVALAVMLSLLPVWSGSFDDGFQRIDGLGIAFVILKTGGFVTWMTVLGMNLNGSDQTFGNLTTSLTTYFAMLSIWGGTTIADMIFSGVIVHKNNKANKYAVINDNKTTVTFSLAPRVDYLYDSSFDPHHRWGVIDSGIIIAAVCCW